LTDDGTKDWANIRIEEPVRDEGRDYPETYTAIMRAGLEALHADMVSVRSDGTVGLHKANEPIEDTPATNGVELGDLRDQLDRIESAASTAEERTGTIERKVDDLGGRR